MKILFIDGTAGFSPNRLAEKPCGGILTSLTIIPRQLAARGHSVSVMSMHKTAELVGGVVYMPIGTDVSTQNPDVVVFNRNSIYRSIAEHFKAKGAKLVWWLHDIVDHRYLRDDGYILLDKIVALSEYCASSYSDFYGISRDLFITIPNGVDKTVFYPGKWKDRNPNLWVHASAPVKGLYPLEFTLWQMRRHNPSVELRVHSSQGLHDFEDTPAIEASLKSLGEAGARLVGPIPQKDLADTFRNAWGLLMPNHYPEICSNVLLQAQACGLPVVASNIGSVSEFITHRKTGMLTKYMPHDMFLWWKDYAEQAVITASDKDLHRRMSEAAPSGVLNWETVAGKWASMLEAMRPVEVAA